MRVLDKDLITNSYHSFFNKYNNRKNWIYKFSILLIFSIIISLPFIEVDISINAIGYVNNNQKNQLIRSHISSIVSDNRMRENLRVKKGDTLIVFRHKIESNKIMQLDSEIKLLNSIISDLKNIQTQQIDLVENPKYRSLITTHQEEIRLHDIECEKALMDYDINKELFEKGVIPIYEFKKIKAYYFSELAKKQRYIEQFKNKISTSLQEHQQRKDKLLGERQTLLLEISNKTIIAPNYGWLVNTCPKKSNSIIYINEVLFELVNTDSLYAELLINPNDIGKISKGQSVKIKIDGYNYNSWGSLSSKISEIAIDQTVRGERSFFIIKCHLPQKYITHQSGIKGEIKKGMGLSSNILVARKTLSKLMIEKFDSWINPNS
jgi:membrane fusion protein, peptide pheromone/bacteriocin exporter